jgi:type II secretory pathway component PulK
LRGNAQLVDGDVASSSRFFLVRGQVRLDRAVTRMEALLKRGPNNIASVLWQRELS